MAWLVLDQYSMGLADRRVIAAEEHPLAFRAGDFFADRFIVQQTLSSGGEGQVLLAHDLLNDGAKVAVKVLLPRWAHEPELDGANVKRFFREVSLLRRVVSPYIISVFDADIADESVFYSMEYVNGPSLQSLIQGGGLSSSSIVWLAMNLFEALRVIHEAGVVHRDIKPGNLLVTDRGSLKVIDFGVARSIPVAKLKHTEANDGDDVTSGDDEPFVGSVLYAAPEVWRGGRLSRESDVYSAGVVLYELLYGHAPFAGESVREIALSHLQEAPNLPDVSSELARVRTVTELALEKDPTSRPSAAQLARAVLC